MSNRMMNDVGRSETSAEVCMDNGGRVRINPIPHDRPTPPEAPPIGCVGCGTTLLGGEGFFVEIDSDKGWGHGCLVVCGYCMAEALRPRNIINANEVS